MSFGKPKLEDKPVQCLNCGETFPEYEAKLRHAGRIDSGPNAGDYWNTECPECGAVDQIQDV